MDKTASASGKPGSKNTKSTKSDTEDLGSFGSENAHKSTVWTRNPITRTNQSTNAYFRANLDKRRDIMLYAVANQALFVFLTTGIFGYMAANQMFVLVLMDHELLPKIIVGYLIFLLFFFYMAKGIRRTRPMNYFAMICFATLIATSAIILATQLDYRGISMLFLNVTCLFVCIMIFLMVTRINLHIASYFFAVLAMAGSNMLILVYLAGKDWRSIMWEAGFSVLYALHFGQRLCNAVEGSRGDITEDDHLYLGLINFMDLPHIFTAILAAVIPIHSWCNLNEEYIAPEELEKIATKVRESDEQQHREYYEKRAKIQSDLYSIFETKKPNTQAKPGKKDKKNK